MRARVFVLSFLLLQMFLVVLVLANVEAHNDSGAIAEQNGFFWGIISFALLVLMPLRGLTSVSLEIKNRTMETILLTRLTAWRVVFGKWSALFAQSLLLVSAVLPYVVLRYFVGGNDIISDFKTILFLLWLSGIFIATSIAVSALGSAVIRIIIVVGAIIMYSYGVGELSSTGSLTGSAWETLGWLMLFGFFIPALLFELTASSLAPVSENHAIRRRGYALLFFILACGLEKAAQSDFKVGVVIPLLVLIGICYYELSEKPRLVPRMVHALARKSLLGVFGALFLLPGWPSGFLFSLLVIPSAIGISYEFLPPTSAAGWLSPIFAALGSVLVPVTICHLLWRKNNQVLLMIVLYNILLLGIASILEGFASITQARFDPILAFFPSLPVLTLVLNEPTGTFSEYADWYFFGNATVIALLILILFVECRRYFVEVFAIFRNARRPVTPPTQPVTELVP
jgi:hypothetical protein